LYLKSLKSNQNGEELLEEVQSKLFKVSQGAYSNAGMLIGDIIKGKHSESKKSFIEELEERQNRFRETGGKDVPFDGVKTGFLDLDKLLIGLGNSHLVILAARPAMGKTAFALSIAEKVSIQSNVPVGMFSLEMTADELVTRMICSSAQIEKSKVATGNLSGDEYQKTYVAVQNLSKAQIIIDDQSRIRMGDLRVRARRMKERYNIGVLIIDYLQLISGSSSYRGDETRQTEVAEISRSMKILAKELKIPILCLAQLSRKVEERADKKPIASDLRESGALEQDADVVLLLSRPEVYDAYNKPGLAQVIIGKNRHGPIGEVDLTYLKQFARFENLSKNEAPSPYDRFDYMDR
jgi:replicative DNA helicase